MIDRVATRWVSFAEQRWSFAQGTKKDGFGYTAFAGFPVSFFKIAAFLISGMFRAGAHVVYCKKSPSLSPLRAWCCFVDRVRVPAPHRLSVHALISSPLCYCRRAVGSPSHKKPDLSRAGRRHKPKSNRKAAVSGLPLPSAPKRPLSHAAPSVHLSAHGRRLARTTSRTHTARWSHVPVQ